MLPYSQGDKNNNNVDDAEVIVAASPTSASPPIDSLESFVRDNSIMNQRVIFQTGGRKRRLSEVERQRAEWRWKRAFLGTFQTRGMSERRYVSEKIKTQNSTPNQPSTSRGSSAPEIAKAASFHPHYTLDRDDKVSASLKQMLHDPGKRDLDMQFIQAEEEEAVSTGVNDLQNIVQSAGSIDPFKVAGTYLFDTMHDLSVDHKVHEPFLTLHRRLNLPLARLFIFAVALLHCMVIFMECPPSVEWNTATAHAVQYKTRASVAAAISVLCIAIKLAHICLRLATKTKRLLFYKWDILLLLSLAVLAFEVVIAISKSENIICRVESVRMLRVLFIIDASTNVKSMVRNIIASVKNLRDAIGVTALILFFFLMGAILLFPTGTNEALVSFPSFHASFMSLLYLLLGSVNFPDVMLPGLIDGGHLTTFFFSMFVFAAVILSMNLFLAVVYETFKSNMQDEKAEMYRRRRESLFYCFKILDHSAIGRIDKASFLSALKQVKDMSHHDDLELDYLWGLVAETQQDDTIGPLEFFSLGDLLICDFEGDARKAAERQQFGYANAKSAFAWCVASPWDYYHFGGLRNIADWCLRKPKSNAKESDERKRRAKQFYAHRKDVERRAGISCWRAPIHRFFYGGIFPELRPVLIHPWFMSLIFWTIMASTINTVLLANMSFQQNNPEYDQVHVVEKLENIGYVEGLFVYVFCAEFTITMIAVGFYGYWKTAEYAFDGIIVLTTVAARIIEHIVTNNKTGGNTDDYAAAADVAILVRVLRLFRALRVFRILDNLKNLRKIFMTFGKFIPIFPRFFALFFIIFYLYGQVGISLFAGKLTDFEGTPMLKNTTYYTTGFYDTNNTFVRTYAAKINFNSVENAWVSCFMLLMLNNWNILADAGFVALDPENENPWNRYAVALYFLSFIFFAVLIGMNLVIATYLEIYAAHWDEKTYEEAEDKRIRRRISSQIQRKQHMRRKSSSEMVSKKKVKVKKWCARRHCDTEVTAFFGFAGRPCAVCFQSFCKKCCQYALEPRMCENKFATVWMTYQPILVCKDCHYDMLKEHNNKDLAGSSLFGPSFILKKDSPRNSRMGKESQPKNTVELIRMLADKKDRISVILNKDLMEQARERETRRFVRQVRRRSSTDDSSPRTSSPVISSNHEKV